MKIYQGSDNFGDNGAEYFATFAQFDPGQGGTPAPGNVFYDNGVAIVPEPFAPEARNGDNLARGRATHLVEPLESSHGWYDLSVTVGGDGSWSRRYTGHLEDGRDSITG